MSGLPLNRDIRAHFPKFIFNRLDQRVDIDRCQRLVVIEAPEKPERSTDHALHLVELLPEARLDGRIIQSRLDLQPQARERSLQVV